MIESMFTSYGLGVFCVRHLVEDPSYRMSEWPLGEVIEDIADLNDGLIHYILCTYAQEPSWLEVQMYGDPQFAQLVSAVTCRGSERFKETVLRLQIFAKTV